MLQPDSFAARLDAAVKNTDLTLSRLAIRLAAGGTPVSTATLSLWRAGRTKPRRREALRAVEALEVMLHLPEGHLMSCCKENDAESDKWWKQPMGVERWAVPRDLKDQLLRDFGRDRPYGLECVNRHEIVTINAYGVTTNRTCIITLRVAMAGTRRLVVGSGSVLADEHGPVFSLPTDVRGGRLGHVGVYPQHGLVAFEILLGDDCEVGDLVVVEFDAPPQRLVYDERWHYQGWHVVESTAPLGRVIIEARFDEERVPDDVYGQIQDPREGPSATQRTEVKMQGTTAIMCVEGLVRSHAKLMWRWNQ